MSRVRCSTHTFCGDGLKSLVLALLLLSCAGLNAFPNRGMAKSLREPRSDDDKAIAAEPEIHLIGVYQGRGRPGVANPPISVEVRPTRKPVVLVLTSYFSVDWNVTVTAGARIKKVIVSGYNNQEIHGVPDGIPVENRSYYPADGSRRAGGWFFAYEWNTPQWREVVRHLNDETGLHVATFQAHYEGSSFVVDDEEGRDHGQIGLKPQTTSPPPEKIPATAAGTSCTSWVSVGPIQVIPASPSRLRFGRRPNPSCWRSRRARR